MKIFRILIILVSIASLYSCSARHDYVWHEYPITENRVMAQNYSDQARINIIKGKSDSKIFKMFNQGRHHYYGSLKQLSDSIVEQLSEILEIKDVTIDENASKSLTVRVNRAQFQGGAWQRAAILDFEVELANGEVFKYSVRNRTPTEAGHTFHGAIALAVIEIVNDPRIAAYINP